MGRRRKKDMPRRDFLRGGIVAGISALGVPVVYYALKEIFMDRFLFLNSDTPLESLDDREILRRFPQLGPEAEITGGLDKKYADLIIQAAKREGLSRRLKCRQSRSIYGVPDSERYGQSMLEYAAQAVQFLHENIRVVREPLEWKVLQYGHDFRSGYHGLGFIGRGWYTINRFEIEEFSGRATDLIVTEKTQYGGGCNYYRNGQTIAKHVIVPTDLED